VSTTSDNARVVVPADFAESIAGLAGDAGRAWIESLPATVEDLCARWGLSVDGEPMHGYLGLIVPALRSAERCVLKISWADESTAHETAALAAWNGRGAVRLLEADPLHRAMLLERLDSSRHLADLPIGEAIRVAAGLIRRLSVPGPAGLPRLPDVARDLAESIPARWESLGRPIPARLIDAASGRCRALGPAAGDLLVNWDLHYENVLAGEREPWLAIDPKALVGDPEYGIAQLLWTRLGDIEASGGLDRHFSALVAGADLDPALARGWTLVRCVDYLLWALGIGLTEDPVTCERIAEWSLR
jgi:streptomycin 6-kinase